MSRHLGRQGRAIAIAAICLLFTTGTAYATQGAGRNDRGGYTIGANGNRTGIVGSGNDGGATPGAPGGPAGGGTGGPPPGWVPYQIPHLVSSTSYCTMTVYAPPNTSWPGYNPVSGMTLVPCPGAAAPQPVPGATLADQWASHANLPGPELEVNPGYAVTGLTAYLQIDPKSPYSTTFNATAQAPNAIHINCSASSFDVNWGDGSPGTHTTSTGGPYPNGDVTHVYQSAAADDDLTVTSHWGCHWTDDFGAAGTVSNLHSTGHLALPVREIQSVNDG